MRIPQDQPASIANSHVPSISRLAGALGLVKRKGQLLTHESHTPVVA
jgi:hypothetical protein